MSDMPINELPALFGISAEEADVSTVHESGASHVEFLMTFRRNRPLPHQPVDLYGPPVMDRSFIELRAVWYYPVSVDTRPFFEAWARHHQEHGAGRLFEYRIAGSS
jgi:hypothetical protein